MAVENIRRLPPGSIISSLRLQTLHAVNRRQRFQFILGLIAALMALWLSSTTHVAAQERIPGQANRTGELWKLNTQRQACPPSNELSRNPFIPPQSRTLTQAIPVGVNVHINEIPRISDAENRFQVDGLLTTTWCDSRVISQIPQGEDKLVLYNNAAEEWIGSHWSPQLEFTNRVSEAFYQTQTITLRSNGSVERIARFEEGLGSEFKLSKFPFDQQLLRIYLQSFSWDQSTVRLIDLGDAVSLGRRSRLPEWVIKDLNFSIRNHDDPEKGSQEFSQLSATITIARRSGYYIYKIFLPLGILAFTSIFFLAIPIEAFADRLGFISGLLFTTLAYQIIIANSVPRVPYLTLGDTYTIFLFAFMISEVFIAYNISQKVSKDGRDRIPTIERAMEIFLPSIFISTQALFIWIAIN